MRLVAITARHDTLLGTSIDGRFTITELIARGGMGSVYRAYQPSIDRHIAVKVLHPNISADETMLRRFFREAKAISSLHHHNIVQIFDFGQSQEGLLYMVMEFLDGPVLHDVINRGPVPPLRTVNILSQVCDALSAAHGRGIIHRDLKPENIVLLDRAGAPDFVKILDFGLARMAHGSGSDAEKLTEANQFFGTPMYMSPEQVGASDLDGRSDLYSLGIILFEMLVGQPPFTGDSPMSIILAHSRDEPPLLSDACHAYVVPPQLTALCAQLLEKDPARRPPSAAQVKATLREAFETFPGGGFLDPTRASAVTPVALPRVDAGRELATQSLVFRGPGEDHQLMETVMHEVKTPLTVVNSGVDLLASGSLGALTAQQEQFLRMIKRNIRRLSCFTGDVLTFSRLNAGKLHIAPRVMELELTLISAMAALIHEERDSVSPAHLRHEGDGPLEVFADPEAVRGIVMGLARVLLMSFTAESKILIKHRRGDPYAEVCVSATGTSTAAEGLVAAFRSGSPAGDGAMQGLRGVGLRLSVCRAMVERMGGKITVTAPDAEQAIFQLTLPRPATARTTLFGPLARTMGYASAMQLQQAASRQREQQRRRRIGEVLCDQGVMSPEAVEDVLRVQEIHLGHPHHHLPCNMQEGLFGRLALKYSYLAPEQLNRCLAQQQEARSNGEPSLLGEIMVERNLLEPRDVVNLIHMQQLRRAVCGGCGSRYNTARMEKGKRLHCPRCGAVLEIDRKSDEIGVATPEVLS